MSFRSRTIWILTKDLFKIYFEVLFINFLRSIVPKRYLTVRFGLISELNRLLSRCELNKATLKSLRK